MFVRRMTATLVVAISLLGGTLNSPAAANEVSDNAEKFIIKLADDAISQLTDPELALAEQEQRFKAIVHDYIAFKSIARWVLGGRYWRQASEQQREKYLNLFEELMVATYAHRFQNYSGEKLEITGTQIIDSDQALVRTTLMRPNADKPLRVDWRVRATNGSYRVIDIMIEGLSMAQSQRSEFASLLRSNGGSVEDLMAELEDRLNKARAERINASNKDARKS